MDKNRGHEEGTSVARAIAALDEITGADPEISHDEADAILLANVHPDIKAAYHRLQGRCRWWATA